MTEVLVFPIPSPPSDWTDEQVTEQFNFLENKRIEWMTAQTGGAELAIMKLRTVLSRMFEMGVQEGGADDVRDYHLLASALHDLEKKEL